MEHSRVDCGGEEIVGSADGVDVPREMKIEFFHGDDLAVSSACSTALDSECGALTGLADTGEGEFAEVCGEGLNETNCCGTLSFAKWRWRYSCIRTCFYTMKIPSHVNVMAIPTVC